jgi:glycosidase
MANNEWLERQANISLNRLRIAQERRFADTIADRPEEWQAFVRRLESNFPRLFGLLLHLYGKQYDFFYHLERLTTIMAKSWFDRPQELKATDKEREANPQWFQSNQMLGGVCYVDLFAGDLQGVREKIPYFKELGLTYLHLMPLFKVPEGENDGGYAVSSYREVNPVLGTMDELIQLARELHREKICLVLDLVFNHTSDEHEWALRAKSGEIEFQEYYRMFPDRRMPDAYEAHLREIFPEERPGSFTYLPEIRRWVWTTFHSYQWDLNYANPAVFNRMAEELLFLANIGVDALRLDAVAFTWKQLGTNCENLPEAHMLIQAFNAITRIAAPAMIFKSEAIVHPDDVAQYISLEECEISYNPLLMALLWNSLATRDVRLLSLSLRERFRIADGCAWVNYVRSHDDIGWTFSDEDAARLGINGHDHRQFLNAYYSGRFPGSFARGLPFQENPRTGDARISGTCASLAGLEKAVREETEAEVDLAIRRIGLIYGIILTVGGIPLIYLGDEVGTLNDYSYRHDAAKTGDSRWVHRPFIDWGKMAQRNDKRTREGHIYQYIHRLIQVRKENPAFSGSEMQVIDTGNDHVLGYVRQYANKRVLVLANFGQEPQTIQGNLLRMYGLGYTFTDQVSGRPIPAQDLSLDPYAFMCLHS